MREWRALFWRFRGRGRHFYFAATDPIRTSHILINAACTSRLYVAWRGPRFFFLLSTAGCANLPISTFRFSRVRFRASFKSTTASCPSYLLFGTLP
jgi:hypothetical protein